MDTPVFIVSTGRCGSTMLSNMVNLHPDLLSISEFFTSLTTRAFVGHRPTGKAMYQRLNTLSPGGKALHRNELWVDEFLYPVGPEARFRPDAVPPILCTTLPHITEDHERVWDELASALRERGRESLASHYRFVFDWLTQRFAKHVWIERSGASLLFVPLLAQMFPDARFVHIYRDGRDTAMSMSRHHFFRLRVQAEDLMLKAGIDPYAPFHLLGTSPYAPWFERLRFQFFTATRYQRLQIELPAFGRFWSRMITRGLGYLDELQPERVLSMCYETVLTEPDHELHRFIRFIGPEFENSQWQRAARALVCKTPPRWQRLDAAMQVQLGTACEPALTLLGYQEGQN